MSTSNQTYKELAIPYFKEVFDIIDKVLVRENIPYYLVGVSAIALELLKKGKKPSRGTKDIDFAIMVSSLAAYNKVVDLLVMEGFTKVKLPWTIYHPEYYVAVDLLPFGQIEENDTVSFTERYADLHVLGFQEVLENASEVSIENKIVKVSPLPGMVILKLVAWSDRPEDRDNDLSDILKIIEAYFEHEWDEIVDNYNDLLEKLDESNGKLKISARVLGRKAREYLLKSEALSNRILGLLDDHLLDPELSPIAKQWAAIMDTDVEETSAIIKEFEIGLKE